jgi:four helix bundle protein
MQQSFKGLTVWKRAMYLTKLIYQATQVFPKEELYGLTQQIRRSAVSIPSNIAEGCKRNSDREFNQFLGIAKGSLAELETQIIIAMEIGYLGKDALEHLEEEFDAIGRMLLQLQRSLQVKQ